MNQINKLKKNTLILGIATIGSRGLAFILAPIYSYYLTTSEYGTMDLVTTTVGLLAPIVVANSYEAAFRFASDANSNKQDVLTNSLFISIVGIVIMQALLAITFPVYHENLRIVLFSGAFIIINGLSSVLGEFARGLGKVKTYAFSGLLSAALQLVMSYVFMVYLKWGLLGWLLTYLLAQFANLLFLFFAADIVKYINLNTINKKTQQSLLKYCIPMIPTTLMWWIMNVSDRYVITLYWNTAMNGLYAVANKIPAVISVLDAVFYQAWQMSAIDSMNVADRDRYYSKIFNAYKDLTVFAFLGILLVAKPILHLFDKSYFDAAYLIPPLLAGAVLHCLASHLGSYYTVFFNTVGAFKTASIGAAINIILNFVFVKEFGLIAAALTTLFGYFITLILRWKDIRKYIHLELKNLQAVVYIILCVMQTCLYYMGSKLAYLGMIVIVLFYAIKNIYIIKQLFTNKQR